MFRDQILIMIRELELKVSKITIQIKQYEDAFKKAERETSNYLRKIIAYNSNLKILNSEKEKLISIKDQLIRLDRSFSNSRIETIKRVNDERKKNGDFVFMNNYYSSTITVLSNNQAQQIRMGINYNIDEVSKRIQTNVNESINITYNTNKCRNRINELQYEKNIIEVKIDKCRQEIILYRNKINSLKLELRLMN